jgi:hypothetical protein
MLVYLSAVKLCVGCLPRYVPYEHVLPFVAFILPPPPPRIAWRRVDYRVFLKCFTIEDCVSVFWTLTVEFNNPPLLAFCQSLIDCFCGNLGALFSCINSVNVVGLRIDYV